MEIAQIMTKNPHMIHENATVSEAIKKMRDIGSGILPVGNPSHIKGVITDRDILMRAVAENKNLDETPVSEIMSKNVVACEDDAYLKQVVYKMNQHNIRRVLIKDKTEKLTGIISLGDIVRRVQDPTLLASLFKETEVA